MTITINNTDYTLKYSIRALFIFEKLAGYTFKMDTIMDTCIFFYSIIMANNADCKMTFDDFLTEIDNDNTLLTTFNQFLSDTFKVQNQLNTEEDTSKK